MVCLESTTKTAVLGEAQRVYEERVRRHESEETECRREYCQTLKAVQMDGWEVDLSTYKSEDLTFLIQTIANTSVPIFTVEIRKR